MLTDQDTDFFLSELFNALPDQVVWMRAIRDETAHIVNFRVDYTNQSSIEQCPGFYQVGVGTLVFQKEQPLSPIDETQFQTLCSLVDTGQDQEHTYFDQEQNRWYTLSRKRVADGVLLVQKERSEPSEKEKADRQGNLHQAPGNTTTRKDALVVAKTIDYLQSVIDFSQAGICVVSPVVDKEGVIVDFRFQAINRLVAGLVGKTPDQIRGEIVSDWFTSYRETVAFESFKQTYETGKPQRYEINYNVDGFDVWFDVQCTRQENDVLVTFTDFTQLKQAQQAVEWQLSQNKKQAKLLNSILDGSDSGIMAMEAIRDPKQNDVIVDFRIVMANQACVKIVGKSLKQMIGRTLLRAFPGNRESGLFDAYARTTESGEPFRTETYYNYDGLDFWLVLSAQKLGDGFVVTFSDITAVKRATKVAKQSATQLQTVIDTAQTGIFLFVPVRDEKGNVADFRFQTANRQLAGYVGQEPDAVVGELGSRWFPDYKSNGLFERYRHTYETGETLRFDFHYDGGGIDAWLDIMATKTDDAVLVTFSDYTPLKKLQQELENSVADLKRSNENLQQFAYVASHDLQEPLRKIQAFGDMLKSTYGESLGDGADIINRMQAAAGRMSSLIRDLLTYSRLSTYTDTMRPVQLADVLNRVIDDLELAIADSEATINVGELPVVLGDEFQLQQLFQNLLSNALKFKRPSSTSVINIKAKIIGFNELPFDIKPLRRAATYFAVSVSDNGIGFDERYRTRIFQVFQRLHGKLQYAGTGIGLAIVQKVADNHGGAVSANAKIGEGATFTVYLPR